MKKRNSIYCSLLIALLVISLTACTSAITTPTTTAKQTTNQTTSPTTTAPTTTTPTSAKTWDKAEVTLTWLCATAVAEGPLQGWLNDYIIKKTGIQIEIIKVDENRLQVLFAGGELEDLVTFNTWDQADIAVQGKLLVNLDDYTKNLPNMTNNFPKALQFYREEKSNGTGKNYFLPYSFGDYSLLKYTGNFAPYLRWDLYQQVGAPDIKEIEDLLPVLRKMQDLYPKTETGTKTYSFSIFSDWDGLYGYHPKTLQNLVSGNPAAANNFFLEWNVDTKETKPLLDKGSTYMRGVNLFYTANQMGLLDPDSMTQKYADARAKLEAGSVLSAWVWAGLRGAGFNTDERINADPPIGFAPVFFDNFNAATVGDYPLGQSSPLAIGAATKNLDACLRFVDFWGSYDTYLTVFNGPQGDLWDIDENGKLYATDLYLKNMTDSSSLQLTGGGTLSDKANVPCAILSTATHPVYGQRVSMGYWPDVIAASSRSKLDESWTEKYGYQWPLDLVLAKYKITKMPLATIFMKTANDEVKALQTQVGDVVKQYSWLLIYAKDSAEYDKLYAEMMTKVNGLGIQKVMDWGAVNIKDSIAAADTYLD
jgi:putative aldouronate transport system substrate-binding protein